MRTRSLFLSIVIVVLASTPLSAWLRPLFSGRVVAIADGDTLTVLAYQHVQHKIRLAGIDAPEKKQPFGTKSREAIASKVLGKRCSLPSRNTGTATAARLARSSSTIATLTRKWLPTDSLGVIPS